MAQTILRIPSKVPYGYVEVILEGEMDATRLANKYAAYVLEYKAAEEKALNAGFSAPKSKPAVKSVDDVLDYNNDGPGDVDTAAADLIKSKLGATEVDGDEDAPWNNKPEAEDKPYVKPAAADDWDFS